MISLVVLQSEARRTFIHAPRRHRSGVEGIHGRTIRPEKCAMSAITDRRRLAIER